MFKFITMISFVAVVLLTMQPAMAEDAAPEVVAVRSSAKEHNRRVKQAQAELDAAVERASEKYTQQLIQAKERLIMDLRRTLRDAAESDRPENLLTISTQIEKLDNQITELKKPTNRETEQVKIDKPEGFDRYYGRWSITWPNDHNRLFEIDPKGKVTIRSNSSGNGEGSGVGNAYQAKIIDGTLVYHDQHWTKGNRADGRLMFLKLNPDKTVTVGYSEKDLKKSNTLATANESWTTPMAAVFTPLTKDKVDPDDQPKPATKPKPTQDEPAETAPPVAEQTDDPDPVVAEPKQEGDTFFGVPLE